MPALPQPNRVADDIEEVGVLLADLVDHLDALVAYWDGEQRCCFANRAYKEWFGRGRHELLGITLRELLGPLYELNLPHIEAAYRGEKQVFERAIPRPDGNGVRHSLATYLPRVVDGRVLGMFVHVADVDLLKKLELELKAARDLAEERASHDFLTGLPNRLLLDDRMAEAVGRSQRTGATVCALTIDVDHFKAVNDLHGHAVGDRYLVEIAARLKTCVRDYDTVARIGGDEFFVLAAGIPAAERIESLAERILKVARQPFEVGGAIFIPGLSVGIAVFPRHGLTRDALMLASDRALYAAKRAGRNCFRVAEDEGPPSQDRPR